MIHDNIVKTFRNLNMKLVENMPLIYYTTVIIYSHLYNTEK